MIRNGAVVCNLVVQLSLLGATVASGAADFYQGKTFTIVVGSTPGGGFDTVARGVARHIGDHIAGRPTTIVQNMPGAGSLTAVRYLDATAPKDGTVMTSFNAGLITQSIVERDKVKIDFATFDWIGVVSPEFVVCYGYGPNGVSSWEDMMGRKEFVLGATGFGAGNYLTAATLREVFHAPVKVILGFPGDAERRLAVQRGELDGDCSAISSVPVEWLRDGKAHIFVRFTEERAPEIPDTVPYIGNFAKSQEQEQLLELLSAGDRIGRPFIMSNQLPPDRAAEIRKAFVATMDDPAFRGDLEKLQVPVIPLSGTAARDFIAKLSAFPPDLVAKARRFYE